jgi:hypothetical protein
MVILSIDVGIMNLALCLMTKNKEIILWDVLNISREYCEKKATEPSEPVKCSLCKNNAKYRKNETLYCLRHSKESAYFIPTKDLLPSKIEKMKLQQLKELVDTYSINISSIDKTKKLKSDYISVIKSNILEPVEITEKKVKASEISLITISRIMTDKLDKFLENHLHEIESVIIENQISPIATRMTSIQGMLTQYFIMKKREQHIQYISAKNKLKEFDVDKECYKERKKSSIDICKNMLEGQPSWYSFFVNNKKKDDLSDCYLQGVWYIDNNKTNTPPSPSQIDSIETEI